MDETLSKIVTFLSLDEMQHFIHLKYLRLYQDSMQYHLFEENGAIGILLRYPTRAVSWDTSYYPQTEDVLLPVASSHAAAETLARYVLATITIPMRSSIVIKFCEPETKHAFSEFFALEPARVFVSYSTQHPTPSDDDVVVSSQINDKCLPLYLDNGYSLAEMQKHIAEGILSFTLYAQDEPLCTCFVFRNFGLVWEIGGVHTVEQARRQGYARKVVQKAVNTLLEMGYIPRYQTDEMNIPSTQLALSIGLTPCLRLEHYLATAKS